MDKDSSKGPGEQALFAGEAWFDPIETGVRGRIRGLIEELVEQETYGPPRLHETSATWSGQSTPTHPVSGHRPGQDGDPRVLVLISMTASSATFLPGFQNAG